MRRGKTQYLVKWIGYREPTWEPEAYLCDEEGGHLLPLQEFLQQQIAASSFQLTVTESYFLVHETFTGGG